jgi:hypothetical protein
MIIVIFDLGYEFLQDNCGGAGLKPMWLEVLSHISLGITCVFLLEIFLSLFAFGLNFYNPFGGIPLAPLHLFDAIVITTTFVLELALKGREEEFAALLIVLRFWRIVKLVEGKPCSFFLLSLLANNDDPLNNQAWQLAREKLTRRWQKTSPRPK